MDSLDAEWRRPATGPVAVPFYYGWVNLAVAAMAMVGTLPGRTQGLGLITEPLLADLQMERVLFARINFWATLLGGLFCLGVGRLIDRFGSRVILTVVALGLGAVVLMMSTVKDLATLSVLITLTRGLGQSALSVISITIVGQWFVRRLSVAMGIYTVVLSIGFMLVFPLVGSMVVRSGWRIAWGGVGLALLAWPCWQASRLSAGFWCGQRPKGVRLQWESKLKPASRRPAQPATRCGTPFQPLPSGFSVWPVRYMG